jgi:hypothetical protein
LCDIGSKMSLSNTTAIASPSASSKHVYSVDALLNLWQPSPMPDYLVPFSIVSSTQCLQPVTLLPIEARRQYLKSFKARPKKNALNQSFDMVLDDDPRYARRGGGVCVSVWVWWCWLWLDCSFFC